MTTAPTAYFSYRGRPITPDDPWPTAPPTERLPPSVLLHHPLVDRLIVQDWAGGLTQRARLDALWLDGYRPRKETSADYSATRIGQEASADHILDHRFYFRWHSQPVLVFHGYVEDDEVRAQLPAICAAISALFKCEVTGVVDQRYNFYYPAHGSGLVLVRPPYSRPRRREHW